MSRIEKGKDVKTELAQLKGEMIKEIGSTRPKNHLASCSLILFLFIFCLLGIFVWSFAATGLVDVPVISGFAYHKPEPERLVNPCVSLETIIEEQLKSSLARGEKTFSVRLPEESLTSTLRTILETGKSELIDSSRAQVMIREDQTVSFFLPLKDSKKQTVIQLKVKAILNEGILQLEPQKFRLGSFSIPGPLTAFFLQPFIQSQLPALNAKLSALVKLTNVRYEEETLIVEASL